ncbi:MAG: DUF3108 domain-containing protein [Campylobacteraceae bacterium]|jgi:hypothetical protein|nr:DUF3108 domain-containing protein [Campylobacteraceae bacterium]
MVLSKQIALIAALLSAFCVSQLCALPFSSYAKYDVKYGIFSMGEATASLKIYENGTYETEVKAKATGLAATLSGKRVETYKSVGKIVDGRLLPDTLEKFRSSGKKTKLVKYVFDHETKEAAAFEDRCVKSDCTHTSEMLPEYAQNDILTLYHNVALMFGKEGVKELNATAIGSKQPVHVIVPEGKQLKTATKAFGSAEGFYIVVILNQEIFSSDKGELYINLDEDDMTASEAVLKNTTLFGDIWGKRIEKKSEGEWE